MDTPQIMSELLIEDLQKTFQERMDAIREEAEQCPALVNPFNIDTDNIRRLSPFEFLLPKRIYIRQDSEQGLHRTFIAYSDY